MQSNSLPFHGNVGALFLISFLPVFLISINIFNEQEWKIDLWTILPTTFHIIVCASWLAIHFVFYKCFPCWKFARGNVLATGKSILYHCNGIYSLLASWTAFGFMYLYGIHVPEFISTNHINLLIAAYIISFLLSLLLYIKSKFVEDNALSEYGSTGFLIHEFFMGRELNPSVLGVDLKFVCELRPGLIAHILYTVDALLYEECIISTMDITDEGFGWMLCFGDLCWVPFLYSFQTRYIFIHQPKLSTISCIIITGLFLTGYYIFRSSNSQKHNFKRRTTKNVAYIESKSGKRLLIDGLWAHLRHPNYLGDIIMAFSWAAYSGMGSALPYIYPVYLTILLISREIRDEKMCAQKYEEAWKRYCERVPYRVFPAVW